MRQTSYMPPPTRYDVFLSYSSADTRVVHHIADKLRKDGFHIFLDAWEIIPGTSILKALGEGLADANACAVFVGPGGFGPWHQTEAEQAVYQRIESMRGEPVEKEPRTAFRIIPVLLPGRAHPERVQMPPFLNLVAWVEFSGVDDSEGLRRLKCGIRGIPPGSSPTIELPEGTAPYLGLRSFQATDRALYFGREALTADLVKCVATNQIQPPGSELRFVGVIGASGSGKSSLLHAGLKPHLNEGYLPGSHEWPIVELRPGPRPLENLVFALRRHPELRNETVALDRFETDLEKEESTAKRALHRFSGTTLPRSDLRLVVIVDQLEEVFSRCEDRHERSRFLELLIEAAALPGGQTVVVIALRADFLGRCAEHERMAAALSAQVLVVGPMGPEALREAIEAPAHLAGGSIEPTLIDRLVLEAQEEPGALPLLQHVLKVLWDGQSPGERHLSMGRYLAVGELQGALGRHAEGIYDALPPEQKALAGPLFCRLVQPGEGAEDTKRRITWAELPEDSTLRALVTRLADEEARLLITDGDEAQRTLELAHEALLNHWPRLKTWVSEDREALRTQHRVTEATKEVAKGHSPKDVLSGAYLAAAEEWLEKHPERASSTERKLIAVAQEARDQAIRRERNRLRGGITFLSVLALALGLAGFQAYRQFQRAESALGQALEVANLINFTATDELENIPGTYGPRKRLMEAAEQLLSTLTVGLGARRHFGVERARMIAASDRGQQLALRKESKEARREFLTALKIAQWLSEQAPDFQRDLSVAHNQLGDLERALGNGEKAKQYFEDALAIRKALVAKEPNRADFQRDLSVSYTKLGDLERALGNGEKAKQYFEDALAIRKALAAKEPNRADFQRDLSVSYERLGDLERALGNGEKAKQYFEDALAIAAALAAKEPNRADFQRDLSVSYDRLGDLERALGNGEKARQYFEDALAIRKVLAAKEPNRTDFQRDLSVSYDRLGNLERALENGEKARQHFEDALAIVAALAAKEPNRADFQRDLSVSYERLGDLERALGNGKKARQYFEDALAITAALAAKEPNRADFQRDLSVSYERLGDLESALGNGKKARQYFEDALAIDAALAAKEPNRADFQRGLANSFERMVGTSSGAAALAWIDRSITIRRSVLAQFKKSTLLQRELAIALLIRAQIEGNKENLSEARELLEALASKSALEAKYYSLLEYLRKASP